MKSDTILHKKYEYDLESRDDIKAYVQNGYIIYQNVHEPQIIEEAFRFIDDRYNILLDKHRAGKISFDVHGWSVGIIERFAKSELGESFFTNTKLVRIMQKYLGPDICLLSQDALWINVPKDSDPVLNKGLHTDAWTGTSINTIFVKTFFTDVDEYNGISVAPGSHLQGLVPVRNRELDPEAEVEFEQINLTGLKRGDILIWHPLLLHSTTGHSDKKIRISITSRFTSSETHFSSQERALGYRALSVSPHNQILRLIGSDSLNPFRTYGGYVGIDRRLSKLYGYSNYEVDEDYEKYI